MRNAALIASLAFAGTASAGDSAAVSVDLLSAGEWQALEPDRWVFGDGRISGRTLTYPEVATSEPDAGANLVSRRTFPGSRLSLATDLVFHRSRYLGVYLDYDPASDTGIWMATGHPLSEEEAATGRAVPTAYIKTVDNGHWIVRARGELIVERDAPLRLRWERNGRDYQVWQDDRLVASYRPVQHYGPGKVRLRLMSAVLDIERLDIELEALPPMPGDAR